MPAETKNPETLFSNNVDILEEFQHNEEQQAELTQLYINATSKFIVGKVIDGTIIGKENSGILVDIGYKSDGHIFSHEFSDFEFKKIKVNDRIEVLLDHLEDEKGCVVLSYQKAKSIKAWGKIAILAKSDEPVSGVVTHKVKGGLSVDVGIPAFLPGSQIDTQRVNDFDQFVGQEVVCKILKINRKRGNIIVSRRKFLEEQQNEDKKKALETLAQGQIVQGVVKNITNYGAFVDVGGVDGLLHITDISWGRIGHPSELLKIGDTLSVKVISFDKEREKISLGIKQLSENPWTVVTKKYPIASKIKGRVSSIADYGLFMEVEKGIEGLVHISEVSWTERIVNLSKYFSVGQEIEVIIVAVDVNNRRMSLSIKQMKGDPWKTVEEKFNIGDKITGEITNVTDFGLFVQLYDGVDGLVHVSDISWTEHVPHPSDKFKKGTIISALILAMDTAHKKISLGIKQLSIDPWKNIEQDYPIGSTTQGTVSKITNFGAFVKLPTGIEGLVHISELTAGKDKTKAEEMLKVGQTENFKIIKMSQSDKRLGLSLRALESSIESAKDSRKTEKSVEEKAPKAKHSVRAKEAVTPKSSLQKALQDFKEKEKNEITDKKSKEEEE